MTTLAAPTAVTQAPVPWRRMAWVTWRQHRTALIGMAVFLGALAVYLLVSGLQLHHAYATDCASTDSLSCGMSFTGEYGPTSVGVSVILQAVPALVGAFLGAPVLAREMETGTYRYAWTQGIGRWRWALGKLVPLAVVVVAAAAFSALFTWYNRPFVAAGYVIPFAPRVFDLTGIAFAAWTLAAFAIGAFAGMLIRRVVPAIAATLAAYSGLALATGMFLREHYLSPLTTSDPNLPASAWAYSQWYTKDGRYAFPTHGSKIVNAVTQLCQGTRVTSPGTTNTVYSPEQCLTQHGYTLWTSYHPGSRFWPFQWIEVSWLVVLAAVLIAATVWLVRRRTA